MAGAAAQPMTFDAANEWLRSRVNVPTGMTSAELALAPEFDAQVRMHCFFSARVQHANAVEAVRTRLDAYAAGETDIATARWQIKKALVDQGYAADDVGMTDTPPAGMDAEEWTRRKAITNLASTRRLDLILNQNARMAWALGRKQVSEHPAVMERWPNYEYMARDDARPTHAALDGIVLAKTDPFWETHTPPWDFNCRCDIEDSDDPAAGAAVTTENPDGSQTARIVNPKTAAQGTEILPNDSGFVFRSDEPFAEFDMGRVKALDLRRAVHASVIKEAERIGAGLTLRGAGAQARGASTVVAPENVKEIRTAFAQVKDAVDNERDLPELRVSLGKVLPEHADSLGIAPEETSIWFNSPGQKRKQGAAHWVENHPDTLDPNTAVNLLERTVWNSVAAIREHVKGPKARRLLIEESGGDAIAVLRRRGTGWELDIEDTWEQTKEYEQRKSPRERKRK